MPGSGKTTLARALAGELGAELLSLDDVKEALWASGPPRDAGELRLAAEREVLGRATAADGDVVLDIWVAPGRDDDRVATLLRGCHDSVVQVGCVVPADVAVARYVDRGRSGGPHGETDDALLQRIRDAVPLVGSLRLGPYLEVDTSGPVDVPALVGRLADLG